MAFETKLQPTSFAGMNELVEGSSPFNALGKTMSDLDGLLDKRQGDAYIKDLGNTGSVEDLSQGILNSPNEYTTKKLTEQRNTLMALNKDKRAEGLNNLNMMLKREELAGLPQKQEDAATKLNLRKEELKDRQKQTKIENDRNNREEAIRDGKIKVEAKERMALAKNDLSSNATFSKSMEDIIAHPGAKYGTGMTGAAASKVLGSDEYDFRASLKNIDAKLFSEQIKKMRGLGSLSDAEGKKISMAVVNLDPNQSHDQLMKNLKLAQSILIAGRKILQEKYSDIIPYDKPMTKEEKLAAQAKNKALIEQQQLERQGGQVQGQVNAPVQKVEMKKNQDGTIMRNGVLLKPILNDQGIQTGWTE